MIPLCQTTRCHVPEEVKIATERCERLRFHSQNVFVGLLKYYVMEWTLCTILSKSFVAVSIGCVENFTVLTTQVVTGNEIFLAMLFEIHASNCLPSGVNVDS